MHDQLHRPIPTADEIAAPFVAGIFQMDRVQDLGELLEAPSSAPNDEIDARARQLVQAVQEATALVVLAARACLTHADPRRLSIEHHVREVMHVDAIDGLAWENESDHLYDLVKSAGWAS